ncbi:hypothetical protein ACFQ3Z_27665 [Streptomyces nogalater]
MSIEWTVSFTVTTRKTAPTAASTIPSSAATRYQTRRGRKSLAGMFCGTGGGPAYGCPDG